MFVTEIRPLNKKKSRILFDDGEDLVLYNGEIRASRIKEQEELPDDIVSQVEITVAEPEIGVKFADTADIPSGPATRSRRSWS